MEKLDLQKELDFLLAERLLSGFLNYENCIDWAISLMQRGYESENLSILAGLDTNDAITIEHYFDRLIADLQLESRRDENGLLHIYTSSIARQVIDGKISPQKGLSIMEEIYFQAFGADSSKIHLTQFSLLADDITLIGSYQIFYIGLTKRNIDEVIIEEMKMFLLKEKRELPNISNLIYCKKCKSFGQSVYKEQKLFLKHKGWYCKECNSKNYLAWYKVEDRLKIIKILENE